MSDTFKLVIDGQEIDAPREYSLLQACEMAGAEIPRFCYHERLSVAGNCRMCLVEWRGAPKPIASCAQTVGEMRPNPDGTPPQIFTHSDYVKKARNGVMEFLLINHPLDCPICDQGGECDLQDQAMAYGRSGSRFELNKRAVDDKDMGSLVKTIMTRCIQCTRCVRFVAEVAGVEEIGMTARGEDAEITTYLEQSLTSELSGNVIDLCPVGALTSKPYAFTARPWELRKTDSIDVMDALGSHIRVDARGPAVLRILPRINDEINEEWLSDKARFIWDGLGRQRLDKPYIRKNGRLHAVSWEDALKAVASRLKAEKPTSIAALAGELTCVESMKASLDLLRSIGVQHTDCRSQGEQLAITSDGEVLPRESYIMNSTLMGVEEADALLLIGVNPRKTAPVWNARIRKSWLHNDLKIALIGEATDLTYDYTHIGTSPADLLNPKIFSDFKEVLKSAKKPMIVLGADATAREDGYAILHAAFELAQSVGAIISTQDESEASWCGFNILHSSAALVGGLDLGFLPGKGGLHTRGILDATKSGDISTLILLGTDEIDMTQLGGAFVIYVGSHGDAGANRADIILPAATYTEKSAIYTNTEGRVQMTRKAVDLKGEAREDWRIFRALSDLMGHPLPYDDLMGLRADLQKDSSVFSGFNFAPGAVGTSALSEPWLKGGAISDAPFELENTNYYLTNPIARASKTMAECANMGSDKLTMAAE